MTSGLGLGLLDEPYDPVKAPPETQEQILSQQAVALNALVSHLVQGGEGLSFDYHSGGAGSSSTRGAIKREKLQQDLASRQSGFFLALQQQIFRRLNPSAVLPRTQKEIQRRSPSLLTYLERYGGFRGQKEAGLTMWVFAHALDAAASGDFFATKEYLALGVMALEQSVFDAGDWGLAYVLSLIEDPPQTLFQEKMQSITSAGRPFSPLIPPQLAYSRLGGKRQRPRRDSQQAARRRIREAPRDVQSSPRSPKPAERGSSDFFSTYEGIQFRAYEILDCK